MYHEKQSGETRNMAHANFVLKNVRIDLPSHKISEKPIKAYFQIFLYFCIFGPINVSFIPL